MLPKTAFLFSCLIALASAHAATPVTIAQLEQFLTSKHAAKESDAEIAERLNQVTLSEELVGSALSRVLAEARVRPRTAEQVQLLAAESIFEPAPEANQPHDPKPDPATQQRMIDGARAYVSWTLHLLPDLLAVRVSRSFTNSITDPHPGHGKPQAQMHFVIEHRREIAYRNGRESAAPLSRSSDSWTEQTAGLSTWGEFGGMLKIVLNDAFAGHVAWERWQRNESGERVAVFRYSIPEAASHYKLEFCCYLASIENPIELPFKAQPGYHGELFIDPRNGTVDRITVEADLKDTDPVRRSAIAVQYGAIEIGGKRFICPLRGVAITDTHNLRMEAIDGVGLEKHTNVVEFVNYHKFGSTSRVLPGGTKE